MAKETTPLNLFGNPSNSIAQELRGKHGSLEKPKPQRFYDLLGLAHRTLQEIYPGCYTVPAEQFFWVDEEAYRVMFEALPLPDESFTDRNLKMLGADVNIPPTAPLQYDHHIGYRFPPIVFLNSEEFQDLDSQDQWKRTWAEYALLRDIITVSIYHSRIPRTVPFPFMPGLENLMHGALSYHEKNVPRQHPNLDREQFGKLIEGYHDILKLDEEATIEINGATAFYISKIRTKESPQDEKLFHTGDNLNWPISYYLTEKPLRAAVREVEAQYPAAEQKYVRARYTELKKQVKKDQKGIDSFLASIGVLGYDATFKAYMGSSIPILFSEAKEKTKNKRLTFPY